MSNQIDQEDDMPSPTRRRHEELVALLTEIRDRLPEWVNPTLDWLDEPAPVPRPEPADITEEPPVGSQVTDKDGDVLVVSGADLLDGTPIFDIKPYLPFADCHTDATAGYAAEGENHRLEVTFPQELLSKIPTQKRNGLLECLADDPRPSYQDDDREYGMAFNKYNVKFKVENDLLTVLAIEEN